MTVKTGIINYSLEMRVDEFFIYEGKRKMQKPLKMRGMIIEVRRNGGMG